MSKVWTSSLSICIFLLIKYDNKLFKLFCYNPSAFYGFDRTDTKQIAKPFYCKMIFQIVFWIKSECYDFLSGSVEKSFIFSSENVTVTYYRISEFSEIHNLLKIYQIIINKSAEGGYTNAFTRRKNITPCAGRHL